jgi:hypothetical protein
MVHREFFTTLRSGDAHPIVEHLGCTDHRVVPAIWASQFRLSEFQYYASGIISLGGPRSLSLRLLCIFHNAQIITIRLQFSFIRVRPAEQTTMSVSFPVQPGRAYPRSGLDAFASCSVSIGIRAVRFTFHFLNLRPSQSATQATSHWCSLAPDMRLK